VLDMSAASVTQLLERYGRAVKAAEIERHQAKVASAADTKTGAAR
jgi:hypothetical protein